MSLTFGQKLAERRQWCGWSMAQAAHHIDVQVDTYRSWENGRHTPTRIAQLGAIELLEQAALAHALMILGELSTDNSHRCGPICSQQTCVSLDQNTRSSTGAN